MPEPVGQPDRASGCTRLGVVGAGLADRGRRDRLDARGAADGGGVVGRTRHLVAGRDRAGRTRWRGRCSSTWHRFLRVGVPRGQRVQAEGGLDQLQRRGVLERAVRGTTRAAGQVGHHDRRHPEAELGVVGDQLAVGRRRAVTGVVDVGRVGVVDDLRRRHVVVEATPFIEGDDEDGVVQVARRCQGVVRVGDEPLARARMSASG